MKLRNFIHIFLVSGALAGYSFWVSFARETGISEAASAEVFPGTDIPLLNVADAQNLWRQPSTIFVDVRSTPDYEFGHAKGAVSLPYEELDERFAALKPQLDRAQAIVVYCKNSDCGKSYWSALYLRKQGLKQVRIYPNGWYEWCQYELPIAGQRS
jgi:rhodanese-related sulfurtransferase